MTPVDQSPPPGVHAPPASTTGTGTPRPWRTYTVRPGDSLTVIARRHRTTVRELVTRNRLRTHRILAGSRLQVPAAGRASAPAVRTPSPARTAVRAGAKAARPVRTTVAHTVRRGESLVSIARRYGTGWRALSKANRIADPARIHPGQVLRVPVPTGTTAATPGRSGRSGSAARPARSGGSTFAGRTYPAHVVASADAHREQLRRAPVPTRTQTRTLIVSTARRYGVNPRLALAVGWQESGWNQRAVSVADAIGVMQVLPGTGTWCSSLAGRRLDLLDAADNVTAGVVLLRWLTANADSLDQAIAGYYQGLGGVRAKGMYPDTKVYVRSVKAHMARF